MDLLINIANRQAHFSSEDSFCFDFYFIRQKYFVKQQIMKSSD